MFQHLVPDMNNRKDTKNDYRKSYFFTVYSS